MADGDDLVYRPRLDQNPGLVLFDNSNQPGWNPDGVLGAVTDMNPPANSLDVLMTPDEQKSIAPLDDTAGGIDGMPGVWPPGWDDGSTPPAMSVGEGSGPDLEHPIVAGPAEDNSGDGAASAPQAPVGPVPGFPETGTNSWRAGLDDQITTAAENFNEAHGYKPGDPLHVSPQMLKSWAMSESGGDRKAFEGDTLQVNTKYNWSPDKADLGLVQNQTPTPSTSLGAGLEWLNKKAVAGNGPARDMHDGLTIYRWGNLKSGNSAYADAILGRTEAMNADGQ